MITIVKIKQTESNGDSEMEPLYRFRIFKNIIYKKLQA